MFALNSVAARIRRAARTLEAFAVACATILLLSHSIPDAMAQGIQVESLDAGEGALAATPTPMPDTDTTPIETEDWGLLPREAIWGKDGSVMVLIPAGEFVMGLDNPTQRGGRIQEGPAHKVWLSTYYIDKYEVTNRQYSEFCRQTGHIFPRITRGAGLTDLDNPVVGVTWDDAMAYAAWAGKELPTEAQWEKAARGTEELRYPWGNEWDPEAANTIESGLGTTAVPGSFARDRSPYGVFDMAGNVAEWVFDWYDRGYYRVSPSRNPTGPTEGVFSRVVRGGDYDYGREHARTTDRRYRLTNQSPEYLGFRCVRVLRKVPTPVPPSPEELRAMATPTPVLNPFETIEESLSQAWLSGEGLPATLSPLNVGRQSPITLINELPLELSFTIVSDDPRIVLFDQKMRPLGKREIRLAVSKNMVLYVRLPGSDDIVKIGPVFQSNSRPIMVVTPDLLLPRVVETAGTTQPPKESPEMRVYYEMPRLPWNVARFYNDTPTTASLEFPKCPIADCASDERQAEEPFSLLLPPRAIWEAAMIPGRHTFEVLYLGTFDSGAGPQRIEISNRFDERAVVLRENMRTNERVRVFARQLQPVEVVVLEEMLFSTSR